MQRSLALNLTSDAVTETNVQVHWSYLSSMWTLPTTEDGEFLEAKHAENPCSDHRWPPELGTIYLIVQNMREVEILLSNIQFMSDKELIDPWQFQVLAIGTENSTIQIFQHSFTERVWAAEKYIIELEFYYPSDRTDDDDGLINKLDLSIGETVKSRAANDSHFDRYVDYKDFQRTRLWLIDNGHPLTRSLYGNGLIEITEQGRYLYSVEEINYYKDVDTDDDDAEHVTHKQFDLMEQLVFRLRSSGIPCDYIHFHSDESPDVRNLSRLDHDFDPLDP